MATSVNANNITFADGTNQGTAATGGGVPLVSYDEFNSSGSWTKSGNANVYEIHVVGGGGQGAKGGNLYSTPAAGGGGGGGGAVLRIDASALSSSAYTITVGSGGYTTSTSTNGFAGAAGGGSSFGNIITTNGGNGGGNGNSSWGVNGGNGGTGTINVTGNFSSTEAGQNGADVQYNTTWNNSFDNTATVSTGYSGRGGTGYSKTQNLTKIIDIPEQPSRVPYKYQSSYTRYAGMGSNGSSGQTGAGIDGVVIILGYEE